MDINDTFDYVPQKSEDILFETTHIRNKHFFQEFYSYWYFKRPLIVAIYILIALSCIANFIPIFFGGSGTWVGLVAPIVYLLFMFFAYKNNVKVFTAREKENGNGTPIVYTTQVSESAITCITTLGTKYEVQFTTVKKVIVTKHYLHLQTPTRQCFPIKKDGFTKGTYEDFCEFLRSKNFKVKTK